MKRWLLIVLCIFLTPSYLHVCYVPTSVELTNHLPVPICIDSHQLDPNSSICISRTDTHDVRFSLESSTGSYYFIVPPGCYHAKRIVLSNPFTPNNCSQPPSVVALINTSISPCQLVLPKGYENTTLPLLVNTTRAPITTQLHNGFFLIDHGIYQNIVIEPQRFCIVLPCDPHITLSITTLENPDPYFFSRIPTAPQLEFALSQNKEKATLYTHVWKADVPLTRLFWALALQQQKITAAQKELSLLEPWDIAYPPLQQKIKLLQQRHTIFKNYIGKAQGTRPHWRTFAFKAINQEQRAQDLAMQLAETVLSPPLPPPEPPPILGILPRPASLPPTPPGTPALLPDLQGPFCPPDSQV